MLEEREKGSIFLGAGHILQPGRGEVIIDNLDCKKFNYTWNDSRD